MKKSLIIALTASLVSMLLSDLALADIFSEEAKLGANSGAMNYCRGNFMTEDDNGRYNILALKTLEDFNRLSSGDKVKALVYKKAAENGDYLGEPLTQERCENLRQLLYVQYGQPSISN
ncbi:MAG TPA: hypothetical protein DCF68_12885 [Cyanothece sp. UBA12306]|nr:hypothetical protein [Cyanothece sp. UBA12306]